MDFRPTDEQNLLRRSVREFAETEIRPHVREWDEAQHFPVELLPRLAELGLMGIQFPEAYGGAGMSAVDYCICIEELARVDPSIALSVAAHNGLCSSHIFCSASEVQKQKYLVPLARGEKLGAWGLTESTSGSDAAGMRTTAARDGEGLVLNGSKTFTTHGRAGDIMVVMAITDRARSTRDLSVYRRAWYARHVRRQEGSQARHARQRNERSAVRELPIPGDQLLGEEGQGFVDTMQVLDSGRIGIAALIGRTGPGRLRGGAALCPGATCVRQDDQRFQAIQWKLADNATRIEAARLLTYRAAYLKDQGAGRRSNRRWPSCMPARSRCRRPTTASRFTAATAS